MWWVKKNWSANGSVLEGALNNLTISQSALDGIWLVGLVVFLVLFLPRHLIGPTVVLSSNVFLQLVFLGGRAIGSTLLDRSENSWSGT